MPPKYKYTIVAFINEPGVFSSVPTGWIKGNFCYWPNGNQRRHIMKSTSPQQNWTLHPIKIYRDFGDYKEALHYEKVILKDSSDNSCYGRSSDESNRKRRYSRTKADLLEISPQWSNEKSYNEPVFPERELVSSESSIESKGSSEENTNIVSQIDKSSFNENNSLETMEGENDCLETVNDEIDMDTSLGDPEFIPNDSCSNSGSSDDSSKSMSGEDNISKKFLTPKNHFQINMDISPEFLHTKSCDNSLANEIPAIKDTSSKNSWGPKNETVLTESAASLNMSVPDIDYRKLSLKDTECKSKRHFCVFCKKLQTKFARHLSLKHKQEQKVRQFMNLSKKDPERMRLITEIRVEGDYLYNMTSNYNKNGSLIVVRRQNPTKGKVACDYKPCGNCGAMYSTKSLIQHFRKCSTARSRGLKNGSSSSRRRSMYVSSKASPTLRNEVLPHLRDDDVTKIILSDSLILLFGNRLCEKYRSPHHHKMIRSKLRCVANFYLHLKKIRPSIESLEEAFDPECYDDVILSINNMCGLDNNTGSYATPATAFSVGSFLKKISFYLVTELIKRKDEVQQKNLRDFIHLLNEGLSHGVYRTVHENQLEQKRRKIIELPNSRDISILNKYLERKRDIYLSKLKESYSFEVFKELMSIILILLQIFNRRRSGEVERIKIEDFLKYEAVEEDDEILFGVTNEEKENAKHYVRFLIRGKLGRGVPVMVKQENLQCLQLILERRKQANISAENPYLFGLPGERPFRHLLATALLKKYAASCGAHKPTTLRGTNLRKQFATKCASMDLGKTVLKDIADYMGHNEKIHLNHYRMPNATKDITRISKYLECAIESKNTENTTVFDNSPIENNYCPVVNTGVSSINTPSNTPIHNLMSDSHTVDFSTPHVSVDNRVVSNVRKNSRKSYSPRLSWNENEKHIVMKEFQFYLENFELPPLEQCEKIIKKYDILKKRQPQHVKAYIHNQLQKNKKKLLTSDGHKFKKTTRNRWSQDEKDEVSKIFKHFLERKLLPSKKQCEDVICHNKILKYRTVEQLKSFINNCNRKH